MSVRKTLGILGGLGPMSSVYFYELITEYTQASCDQEHLDIILSSRASTPDRTAFILGQSGDNPLDAMRADARRIVEYGAQIIAIPCNTAHYFYDELAAAVDVPLVNIIYETVAQLKSEGAERIGVLATEGTVSSGAYAHVCDKLGVGYKAPGEDDQRALHSIIYDQIKRGRTPDTALFGEISGRLFEAGCDRIVLGCTELSLLGRDEGLDVRFADSLKILAKRSIQRCGGTLREGA